ncbi:hypothetical protein CR105_03105 [Massilia eurypsychrophila]|uniref:Uncharacterized protein n=1 Tax=Massilia eurypsychrophila TaxID=1485217 RepID=A0A2G8TJ91_9BURK|nr:hypothetical protein [Massilia eurypsychrophila]PIL46094.1 hypothetical protein CR105_03105 [Massilia eurypsychrophila]
MNARAPIECQSIVLRTPYGSMHIDPAEADDHAIMRVRQLSGLLALMSDSDSTDDMLRLAAKLSAEMGNVVSQIRSIEGSVELGQLARQTAQILLAFQPTEGPSHMLWLAQQLADELVGTIAGAPACGVAS